MMRKYLEAVLLLFCLLPMPASAAEQDGVITPSPADQSSGAKEGCRHPTLRISGRVLDPAGRPIAGARVSAVVPNCDPICVCGIGPPSPGSPDFSCPDTSTEKGLFTLQPEKKGLYWILADAEGYLSARGPDVVLGSTPTEVTLVLQPAAKVRGRVLDAKGLPVAGAKVQLSEQCVRYSFDDVGTAEDGLYEISCARPKRQWAFITHDAYEGAASRVEVILGDNWIDLRLGEPRLAVRGRVVGPQGEPVEAAQVKSSDGVFWVETLADGSFSGWVNRSHLPEVQVEKEGYAPATIAIVPDTDLNVRLDRGAVVTGSILGLSDDQARLTSVYLQRKNPGFWGSADSRKDADGRWTYEIAAVPPGTYAIEARPFNQDEIAHGTVTVAPGETEIKADVVFPPSFEVRGRVLDHDGRRPGVRVNVHFHNGESRLWIEMAGDGSFVKSLPEGTWLIDAESIFSRVHFVSKSQTVEVNGGPVEGLELRIAPGTTLRCSPPGSTTWDRFDLKARGSSLNPNGKRSYGPRDCSLSGLAPGSWEVTAEMAGDPRQVTRRITLEPGVAEMDLDFDLRLGGSTLTGRLAADAPADDVAVELTSPEAPGFHYRVGLTHRTFTFTRLREGRYHLRITRGRKAEEEVLHEKDLSLASDLELGTLPVRARTRPSTPETR